MAQIVTITNPLTGRPAQVDQLEHTAQQIDDAIARALPGGAIDVALQNKAPAGYGLGESQGRHVANASVDTLTKNGWYYLYDGVTGGPSGYSIYHATLFVSSSRSDLTKVQRLILATSGLQGYELRRVYNDTAWLPWEWVNPPMAAGVEYRTTERYLGKPVYTKLVDCGVGPNATRKRVSAGISNVDRAVSANGSWGNMSIPYEWFSGDAGGAQAITITLNDTYIDIASTVNYSGRTIYALIKYTKTTD